METWNSAPQQELSPVHRVYISAVHCRKGVVERMKGVEEGHRRVKVAPRADGNAWTDWQMWGRCLSRMDAAFSLSRQPESRVHEVSSILARQLDEIVLAGPRHSPRQDNLPRIDFQFCRKRYPPVNDVSVKKL